MQGWGTLVVSGRTQKGRFEDLEWSSVTVVAETLADPYIGKIPLPRVNSFQEPFASHQDIQRNTPKGGPANIWNG